MPERVEGWEKFRPASRRPEMEDVLAEKRFLSRKTSDAERFKTLFNYFARGFVRYASPGFARVHYPGLPSIRGYKIAGLEGFARTAPLLAAWLCSGRETVVDGIDLVAILRQGLLNGTNPQSVEYWGEIEDDDQRMVEAADIARLIWLSRACVWDTFTSDERRQVSTWLLGVNTSHIRVRNNWLLFPMVVNAALVALGCELEIDFSNYWEFKALHYRESGWFFDVPEGIDYYNAWGISYDLYWLDVLAPHLDGPFLRDVLTQSADLTGHLISPYGIPIMGRSACYRTAVPTPIVAAARLKDSPIRPGLARRALDAVWSYFISHGVLRQGTLTMGYFDEDPRIIDDYTGPGSSHWGLRALTLAMMSGDDEPLWTEPAQPLPVETSDYCLWFPKLGWTVEGRAGAGEICIIIEKNASARIPLEPVTLAMRVRGCMRHSVERPKNHKAKYKRRVYSAIRPFTNLD